jgi:uncharacterized protein (DUF305 family)
LSTSRLAVLAATCLASVCLASTLAAQTMPHGQMQGQMDSADNPADKAFIGAMRDMMMGMHTSMPTGDTDADFVRMMLPHHKAAVDMAKAEIEYGKDPDLIALAREIVTAQDKEITMMKAWQEKHAK